MADITSIKFFDNREIAPAWLQHTHAPAYANLINKLFFILADARLNVSERSHVESKELSQDDLREFSIRFFADDRFNRDSYIISQESPLYDMQKIGKQVSGDSIPISIAIAIARSEKLDSIFTCRTPLTTFGLFLGKTRGKVVRRKIVLENGCLL